jgi:hypothetical protein
MSMQPTPTTGFVPPPPMNLSQSKPLDKWKPVSDPSLMGKRMKKRGSVEKLNLGTVAGRAARRIAEERRLASSVGDSGILRNINENFGMNNLATIPPAKKSPVTAGSPFDATLGDIYTTGSLDALLGMGMSAIPGIRSAASRAGGAIGTGAGRVAGAIGTGAGRAAGAIGTGAGRAAGAARRAVSAAPSAIASSPRRFVNAVGVLGGPGVQDFGRSVADVFDSSKGKWLDRMQNAYEDMRGIERPWKTPTEDPIGMYEIPGAIKEPKYEIPYPNLNPADPDYRWKRYANDVRQTATDPRRAWRRNRPWVIGGAGLLGAGAYYGLNQLNSGDQSSAPAPAPAAISAPRVTPAPAPAPAPIAEPASEPQVNKDGDPTTGDQTRDTQIAQKYRNYITYIDENGVLQRGQYKNSDAKGQIDPRQLAEISQLVYGLIKVNLPKLAKSNKTEIDDFFNTYVQSQITQMQYNKAIKEQGLPELKEGTALNFMPYLNDTQNAALKLGKSPTSTIYSGTDQPWWANNNFQVIDNTTGLPVKKSMGNKNKYGNDRSVIQKSMTSPVDKFNSTTKKNKYKDK